MLLLGIEAICKYMDLSWDEIHLKEKDYGLPIRLFPPDTPCLFTEELQLWVLEYTRILTGTDATAPPEGEDVNGECGES